MEYYRLLTIPPNLLTSSVIFTPVSCGKSPKMTARVKGVSPPYVEYTVMLKIRYMRRQ